MSELVAGCNRCRTSNSRTSSRRQIYKATASALCCKAVIYYVFLLHMYSDNSHSACFLLPQRLLGEHGEIHLSALGMAVSTMVSIAEILKKDGLAEETRKCIGLSYWTVQDGLACAASGISTVMPGW
eukprot:GHRR01031607.1.p1 GENE.GHRR01031607.1~~GHRR01031607.1.p1  ORF type:complete len:127 (-),score=13.83 GHRR01031607.1:469-849(-)